MSGILIESKITFYKVVNDEEILPASDYLHIHVTIQYNHKIPNIPKPPDYPGYIKWHTPSNEMLKSYDSNLDSKLEQLANLDIMTVDDIET